jgi:hypothetical protein
MSLVLGFDPDFHNSGLAVVEFDRRFTTPRLTHAAVIKVPKALKGDAAVAAMIDALPECPAVLNRAIIEGQENYRGKSKGRATPDVLIRLAHIAGAARREYGKDGEVIVAPKTWKGGTKKTIHQARICARMGWDCQAMSGWVKPIGLPESVLRLGIKGKQWSHVLDAIGLALYGIEQLEGVRFGGRRYGG